jgi:UDP-glucuronate 4-epimerase
MRVLVTGAAGFIGSHTVEALLERGDHQAHVVGLDNLDSARARANLRVLAAHPHAQRFRFERGDVRDGASLRALCLAERFDVVIHLAALVGVRASAQQAARYVDVNVSGSLQLLEAARDGGVRHIVFASSSSVYGSSERLPLCETDACDRPQSPYAASKRAVELLGASYHHLHNMSFTALRFFTVYGPRNRPDMLAHQLLDRITRGQPITLFQQQGTDLRRDWTYVTDIVRGILAAAQRPLGYQIINLARGQDHSLHGFVRSIEQASGCRARIQYAHAPTTEMTRTRANIDKARELLGYDPVFDLAAGARALWAWHVAQRAVTLDSQVAQ